MFHETTVSGSFGQRDREREGDFFGKEKGLRKRDLLGSVGIDIAFIKDEAGRCRWIPARTVYERLAERRVSPPKWKDVGG